ncbi:MAG TPA: DNA repair protein RecO [Steroidobacteraceae bacterium]|nr:DNA repair protein RecO [Steroidobacteraceae bacterium]
MSRNARRIQLIPGYILHHRPYRDTSRILEVITRDHGRLSLFARGVRGPKAKLASILQPFQLLLLSWLGRGEAAQLTGAESAQAVGNAQAGLLPPGCLMAAFYLNELLLKLTTRHDPLPVVFDTYHETLQRLRQGVPLEPELRVFEKRLLESLGYGLDLGAEAQTGKPIEPGEYYHFRPEQGLVATVAAAAGALAGESLIELAHERLAGERALEDSKRLLQAALAQCLEGRPLATRAVARAVARRESAQERNTHETPS